MTLPAALSTAGRSPSASTKFSTGASPSSRAAQPKLPRAGRYDVRLAYTPNPNRATNVRVVVESADGERIVTVNQQRKPDAAPFHSLGTFRFEAGERGRVTVTNAGANRFSGVNGVTQDSAVNLDKAFVQFGPITAGKAQSFYDFYANDYGFSVVRT